MKCGRCEPDYCGCHDFFEGLRAWGRGDYDHLLRTPEDPPFLVRHVGDGRAAPARIYPRLPRFTPAGFDRVWYWRTNLPKRKGQRCRVLARGTMNSALIEFEDGVRHVVSRYAFRKA